jgi:hypothetical protein
VANGRAHVRTAADRESVTLGPLRDLVASRRNAHVLPGVPRHMRRVQICVCGTAYEIESTIRHESVKNED